MAGGHVGLNLYLSELVSDILEPMKGILKGGEEIISTEDMLAKVDKLNKLIRGWNSYTAWGGVVEYGYQACDTCIGTNRVADVSNPEWCVCEEQMRSGMRHVDKGTVSTRDVKGEVSTLTQSPDYKGEYQETLNKMKGLKIWDDEDEVSMMSDSEETYQEVWDRMKMMKLNDDQSMTRNRAQVCPGVRNDNVGALDDEMKNLKDNDEMIDNLDDGMKSMRYLATRVAVVWRIVWKGNTVMELVLVRMKLLKGNYG